MSPCRYHLYHLLASRYNYNTDEKDVKSKIPIHPYGVLLVDTKYEFFTERNNLTPQHRLTQELT